MPGKWFCCFWKGGDPSNGLHTGIIHEIIMHASTHILGARSADDQGYRVCIRLYPEDPGQGYGLSGVQGQIKMCGLCI